MIIPKSNKISHKPRILKTVIAFLGVFLMSDFVVVAQGRVVFNNNAYVVITNSANLVVDNSNANAIAVTVGGNIISEGEYNVVKWNVGTSTGNYVVPFTTSTLVKIPLQVNLTAAGVGAGSNIVFSTYETATDLNTAYPSDVTNMNSSCNSGNALYAIDRFWRIDALSYTTKPTPVINFGYDDAANAIGGTNTITESRFKAERFNSGLSSWQTPLKLYGLGNAVLNTVSGVSVTPADFFKSWTLIDTVNMTIPIGIASVSNNSICSGNSSVITPSGATSYTIRPGVTTGTSFTVTPNSTTTYTISGSNAAGCASYPASNATATILVSTTPTISVGSITSNTICSGNSSVITPSGASTYTLQPGNTVGANFTVSPVSTTVYTINGTSTAGCRSTSASNLTNTITVQTTPTISIGSISSSSICPGNNSVITPAGASVYTLQPGSVSGTSFTVSPTSTSVYTISGVSSGGCASTSSSNLTNTIVVASTPTISISSITTNTICSGNSSIITPSGAGSYTLQPGSITGTSFTVSPTSTTIYTISGVSAGGCVSTNNTNTSSTITVSNMTLMVTSSNDALCNGSNTGSVTVSASGGIPAYTYSWSNGTNGSIANSLLAGVYTVTVTDVVNCNVTQAITIGEPSSSVTISSSSVTASCPDNNNGAVSLSITGGTPNYNVVWNTGYVGENLNNVGGGVYTATITDNNGCVLTNTIAITLLSGSDVLCEVLFIPEIFSPNGDGKNEKFEIKKIGAYANNTLQVFNRWGNLVYTKKQYNNEWNGEPNIGDALGNGLLPAGTYYVVFDFGDDNETKPYTGFVQLEY